MRTFEEIKKMLVTWALVEFDQPPRAARVIQRITLLEGATGEYWDLSNDELDELVLAVKEAFKR